MDHYKDTLTEKERRFCEEYVKDYNATQAYLRVYKGSYYTANTQGCYKLKKPAIKAYIEELQKAMRDRWGDIASVLIEELMSDVVQKDEKGIHNASWQKSVDLLQKQLGLQNQKIDATVNTPSIKIVIGDEEDERDTDEEIGEPNEC